MKHYEFADLSDAERIEARLSWLERKMVEILWLLISTTSAVARALAAWLVSEGFASRSSWLLAHVFVSGLRRVTVAFQIG